MEARREKQKPGLFDFEPAESFAEATFAQNDDLFAAPQRIHDDHPFFEGNPHPVRLSAQKQFGNGLNCPLSVVGCWLLVVFGRLSTRCQPTASDPSPTTGRNLIHPPSLKWPLSLRGRSGE